MNVSPLRPSLLVRALTTCALSIWLGVGASPGMAGPIWSPQDVPCNTLTDGEKTDAVDDAINDAGGKMLDKRSGGPNPLTSDQFDEWSAGVHVVDSFGSTTKQGLLDEGQVGEADYDSNGDGGIVIDMNRIREATPSAFCCKEALTAVTSTILVHEWEHAPESIGGGEVPGGQHCDHIKQKIKDIIADCGGFGPGNLPSGVPSSWPAPTPQNGPNGDVDACVARALYDAAMSTAENLTNPEPPTDGGQSNLDALSDCWFADAALPEDEQFDCFDQVYPVYSPVNGQVVGLNAFNCPIIGDPEN